MSDAEPKPMRVIDTRDKETRESWPDRDPWNRCLNGHTHESVDAMALCNLGAIVGATITPADE